ncbi:MAG: T9SS type A sorting domain-containing protein, partial [Bacteroidota bacterium]
ARDSSIVDTDTANGFESDNDAAGSSNNPKTNALFSNMTLVGPSATNSSPLTLRTNHHEGSGMRIRRNSRLQIYNTVFLGWGSGLRLESEKGWLAAQGDTLTVQNVILAGIRNDLFKTDVADGATSVESWFNKAIRSNEIISLAADVQLADPFNYGVRDFQVDAGSPVLNASWWYKPVVSGASIDNEFFDHVPYVGALDATDDWTDGWTEWAPEDAVYPDATVTKGNGVFDHDNGLHITADETWSGVIKLDGWVYVDEGATLTIEDGTIIRGTAKSVLVVERGGKINAVGTSNNPIVFTSNQGAGLRSNSDWAGVVICGKGINNLGGGEGVAEGGIGSVYGGTDNADNSGIMKYVRIEFPGYEVATGSEVNGLTFCSVGSGTTIDYIQVSNSGDDGYEWFGGAVNAKHLISYRTEDDDFDTDNGYVGLVQFGIAARDSSIVDTDTANGFESDNDAAGSSNNPKTNALFSNMTLVGPSESDTSPVTLRTNHNEGSGARIRRNSRLQIYNTLFLGYGRGIRLESEKGWLAASNDTLTVQYSMLAGIRNDKFKTDVADGAGALESWFNDASRHNSIIELGAVAMLADPFNYGIRDFQPESGSPVLNASYWYDGTGVRSLTTGSETLYCYPNPFNDVTYIDVEVNSQTGLRAYVYDLTGKLVRELYNGVAMPGTTTLEFDASGLSQGVYIGKIATGSQNYTVKMIAE